MRSYGLQIRLSALCELSIQPIFRIQSVGCFSFIALLRTVRKVEVFAHDYLFEGWRLKSPIHESYLLEKLFHSDRIQSEYVVFMALPLSLPLKCLLSLSAKMQTHIATAT